MPPTPPPKYLPVSLVTHLFSPSIQSPWRRGLVFLFCGCLKHSTLRPGGWPWLGYGWMNSADPIRCPFKTVAPQQPQIKTQLLSRPLRPPVWSHSPRQARLMPLHLTIKQQKICIKMFSHLQFFIWGLAINIFYLPAKSLQSCPTLCDPIDSSPPGSPVPRILQARILEWVAISFPNACVQAKSLQSTLCDPMDSSQPGSSVHGTLRARILEWVAISFSFICLT